MQKPGELFVFRLPFASQVFNIPGSARPPQRDRLSSGGAPEECPRSRVFRTRSFVNVGKADLLIQRKIDPDFLRRHGLLLATCSHRWIVAMRSR